MRTLQHKFVEFIPEVIEENVLYISVHYCTAIHKCVCGCGNEVVTPLSPTDWELTFNGKAVSLYPSIGNWNFDCQSHYFIKNSSIEYTRRSDDREILDGRKDSLESKFSYYNEKPIEPEKKKDREKKWWTRILKKLTNKAS